MENNNNNTTISMVRTKSPFEEKFDVKRCLNQFAQLVGNGFFDKLSGITVVGQGTDIEPECISHCLNRLPELMEAALQGSPLEHTYHEKVNLYHDLAQTPEWATTMLTSTVHALPKTARKVGELPYDFTIHMFGCGISFQTVPKFFCNDPPIDGVEAKELYVVEEESVSEAAPWVNSALGFYRPRDETLYSPGIYYFPNAKGFPWKVIAPFKIVPFVYPSNKRGTESVGGALSNWAAYKRRKLGGHQMIPEWVKNQTGHVINHHAIRRRQKQKRSKEGGWSPPRSGASEVVIATCAPEPSNSMAR